jgi:hypothetical protein
MAIHHHLKESQNGISWGVFLPLERRQNLEESVWCAQNTGKGENLFIGVVNLKQGCIKMVVPTPIQSSSSKSATSIAHIQHVIR